MENNGYKRPKEKDTDPLNKTFLYKYLFATSYQHETIFRLGYLFKETPEIVAPAADRSENNYTTADKHIYWKEW